FFSPMPGLDKADATDPDYQKAYQKYNGGAGDDIGFALWGAEKLLSAQLQGAGKDLSRQSYVNATKGKSFTTGVYNTVNYANSRFGGTATHALEVDCSKQQYVTQFVNKSSF
ncbi:MAG: branched-chain amino acid transport system substrate-binding protein, partial [Actinomycetota bacterium]|nr:branched-chain amino acid transport system substrate-binding protein [Actinomycetota bacterium]